MDHHQSYRTLHPNPTTNNKPLISSTSTKRLSRKPSLLLLTSPKSKKQSNSETESQHTQFQSPTTSRFARKAGPHQQSNSIELNNICYISPRNCKNAAISNFFNSYYPSQKDQGIRLSVEQIQTQEVIQYCQQGGSQLEGKGKNIHGPKGNINVGNSYTNSYGKMLGHRKKLSRTSNEFHDIKKNIGNDSSFCRTDAKSKQVSIKAQEDIELNLDMSLIQSQLSLTKQENKSLMTENNKIKCRVEDLRQENEYLYRQIESFNTKISELKQQNDQIKNLQSETAKKLSQTQHQLIHTKNLYEPLLKISQKHLILEYMYKKLRHQNETTIKKNTNLTIQNKRLYHKISVLEKMLQDYPTQQRTNSKSRVRELSPVCNRQTIGCRDGKENVGVAGQDGRQGQRKFDVEVRFRKVSRKEEDFFQLSPQ